MREAPSHVHDTGLVGVPHRQEHVPGSRQAGPRTKLGEIWSRRSLFDLQVSNVTKFTKFEIIA